MIELDRKLDRHRRRGVEYVSRHKKSHYFSCRLILISRFYKNEVSLFRQIALKAIITPIKIHIIWWGLRHLMTKSFLKPLPWFTYEKPVWWLKPRGASCSFQALVLSGHRQTMLCSTRPYTDRRTVW